MLLGMNFLMKYGYRTVQYVCKKETDTRGGAQVCVRKLGQKGGNDGVCMREAMWQKGHALHMLCQTYEQVASFLLRGDMSCLLGAIYFFIYFFCKFTLQSLAPRFFFYLLHSTVCTDTVSVQLIA